MSRRSKKFQAKRQAQAQPQLPAKPEPARWILPDDAFALEDGSEQVELSILQDLEPAQVEWLAEGRLPQGALCVVAGETGTCKSLLAVEWAARTSQGSGSADAALIAHGVDMPGPLMRARLDAAGADVARVASATLAWPQPGDDVSLDALDRRVATLAAGMQKGKACKLLVIDNLEAWAGGLDTSPCRARIHYFLVKLAELAVRTKTAIVALARLNGPAGGRVATRELAELSAIAPVIWLTAKDAEQRGRRLLLPVKNSLGPGESAAAFRIEAGRVAWEPEPVELSDTILAPPSARSVAERQDRESAAEWLIDALSDGPVESGELFRQARTCGISAKTLRRAGKALGLKPSKTSFDGPWAWGIRNGGERGARNSECGAKQAETGDACQDGQLEAEMLASGEPMADALERRPLERGEVNEKYPFSARPAAMSGSRA
ncbi:MAG TPA: AAA family ATPase [Pirellulales bacterium]|nr:AAA family ATPase [Pirellulales bacterium]